MSAPRSKRAESGKLAAYSDQSLFQRELCAPCSAWLAHQEDRTWEEAADTDSTPVLSWPVLDFLLLRTRIIAQLLPRNRDMGEMRYSDTRVPMDRNPAGRYRMSSATHGLKTSTAEGDMAYELHALLGKGTLAGIPLAYPTARLLPLNHELQLLPLPPAFAPARP